MGETTAGEFTITTAEPAFVTNHLNRIVSVNRAAADLLGFEGMDMTGMPCWRLLGGTDVEGNGFCLPHCPLRRAALSGNTLPANTAPCPGGSDSENDSISSF